MERETIGKPIHYSGRTITVHPMAPDVLIRKNGHDFGLYLSPEAGRRAAMESIDAEDKATADEQEKQP